MILPESFSSRYFRDEDPVGKTLESATGGSYEITVAALTVQHVVLSPFFERVLDPETHLCSSVRWIPDDAVRETGDLL